MTVVLKHKVHNPGNQANLLQQRAADPHTSAWVAASAGSGKTKVLIDRLVRLLLSGAEPNRIVCLTYTNAAAAEMTNRLYKRLNEFTSCSDAELRAQLTALSGESPSAEVMQRARRLLHRVLDAPGGIRVDTIHGFSQMVLARFPLEAGLTPGFEVADEHLSKNLLSQAIHDLLASEDPTVVTTLTFLLREFPAETVEGHVRELMGLTWRTWLAHLPDDMAAPEFEAAPQSLPEDVRSLMHDLVRACHKGGVDDEALVDNCARLLESQSELSTVLKDLSSYFYTQAGAVRSRILKASTIKKAPEAAEIAAKLTVLIERELDHQKSQHAQRIADAFTFLAGRAAQLYATSKRQEGVLDYDDLIYHTVQLFTNAEMAPWVLYKLDGGIDHLLLDEAQDTSHQQWQLITSLLEEFFSGINEDRHRTLFVVGDVKQSIYGFQGADPQSFVQNREKFRELYTQSQQRWQDVPLNISFRSAPAVLQAVDSVFAYNNLAPRLGEKAAITHIPFRQNTMGRVELWPLSEAPEEQAEEFTAWDAVNKPFSYVTESSDVLAEDIARKICDWLDNGRYLPSRNRTVQAKDIMILVQRRSSFVTKLVRQLRHHSVPVEGEDRYDLLDQLVVQDLLNLFEFCSLPENDLALACVLKSPFCGLSDDDLITIRQMRGDSLWAQLANSHYTEVATWLNDVRVYARNKRPFDVLMYVLYHQDGLNKLRARFGEVATDICADFTGLLEQFEVSQVPTLTNFLVWIRQTNTEVSRGQTGHVQGVRIMTVHGSKGLQAPIVIMPDTVRVPGEVPPLSLNNEERLVYLPAAKNRPNSLQGSYESAFAEMIAEYYRLLYVAMTRAEDELIVCGWKPKRAVNYERSWYHMVHAALGSPDAPLILGEDEVFGEVIAANKANEVNVPGYFDQTPSPEAPTPRLLSPSSLTQHMFAEKKPAVISARQTDAKDKGITIHRLFELWGVLDEPSKSSFTPDECQVVSDIMNDPQFVRFFTGQNHAEVELRGMIHEKPIRAILDRVGVDDHGVWFLDYKTTTNVVSDPGALPEYMQAQMGCYAMLLEKLYPGKLVQGYVLWTVNQSLTEVPLVQAKEKFLSLLAAHEIPELPDTEEVEQITEEA